MTTQSLRTEQLAGTGDVFDVDRRRIARLPYRARIVYPGRGTLGRIGHVALSLDLSPDEAAFLTLAGRLTLRLEDGRQVDFLIATPQRFSGYVQVLTLNRVLGPPAALHYMRDDARRRIRIVMRELAPTADLLANVNRQLAEGVWTHGTIYDLRAVRGAPSLADAIAAARHVGRLVQSHGRRGPVAIITCSMEMVAVAHAYAIDGALGGQPVEVFQDVDDAEYWVAHHLGDHR
jgi:hypothetical protein